MSNVNITDLMQRLAPQLVHRHHFALPVDLAQLQQAASQQTSQSQSLSLSLIQMLKKRLGCQPASSGIHKGIEARVIRKGMVHRCSNRYSQLIHIGICGI